MYDVVIALVPAMILSVYFFGYTVLIVGSVSVLSCLLTEYAIQKYILKTKVTIKDGSAAVTGVLLAFNLTPDLPVYMVIIGAIVSIGIGKMTFGGLGNNPFNPALVGRVFLLMSFPAAMTSTPVPMGFNTSYTDAITAPTPLTVLKEGLRNDRPVSQIMNDIPSYENLFFGNMGGAIGEIAGAALILGLLYMLIRKVITWHIPITTLATIFGLTGILWLINPESNADPLFHLLTGGVLLGAIYMATDYVTSPMSKKGMLIYSIGIGVITVVIRVWGAYPEGISFAILIMNAFVPIINRYMKPRRFGKEVQHG
jgi:electron transport complex protein RnfD